MNGLGLGGGGVSGDLLVSESVGRSKVEYEMPNEK